MLKGTSTEIQEAESRKYFAGRLWILKLSTGNYALFEPPTHNTHCIMLGIGTIKELALTLDKIATYVPPPPEPEEFSIHDL